MPAGQGTPIVTLDDIFVGQAEALATEAGEMADAELGRAQRPWQLGEIGDWSGDPFDIAGITNAYIRDNINEAYKKALDPKAPGTVSDCMAAKLQVDWLAMEERAFRTRHCSPIRASIHAAARRTGHSHAQGIFRQGVVGYVQNVLSRGS